MEFGSPFEFADWLAKQDRRFQLTLVTRCTLRRLPALLDAGVWMPHSALGMPDNRSDHSALVLLTLRALLMAVSARGGSRNALNGAVQYTAEKIDRTVERANRGLRAASELPRGDAISTAKTAALLSRWSTSDEPFEVGWIQATGDGAGIAPGGGLRM